MAITKGDTLPGATLVQFGENGPEAVELGEKLKGRKVVIFAVPGAFTPTCHSAHVPSFIRTRDGFADKGVDEIICVSVNEVVVHGIPGERMLEEGDILSVDIAAKKDGYHGDMNVSMIVGQGSAETERLLGIGLVGTGAGELIAEGVVAVEMGATASDFKRSIHPHPTLSETIMEAAEVFFGQATHVHRPRKR